MIVPLRQQALNFWQRQTKPQRITLVALVLAAVIIIPILVTWAGTPSYSVAFSGLTETDAGQIVEKLAASNIPYQLKNTGTVLVPTNQVYEVRLSMARQGIPQNSTVGFEVFSNNALGMTEFTQKINYQRALAGELERTIASLDAIDTVRVHIVTPEKTLFSNEQQATTASVTLKFKLGKRVDQSTVNAITNLVANSVEGMKPEKVAIIDSNGKMLTSVNADNGLNNSLSQADSHRQIELQTAQTIEQKVQAMLDSVLGANRSTAQAVVEMDWSQRETTSQSFNPTPAAIRSSHVINEAYTLGGTTAGIPGAASNLPTPVPTVVATGSNTLYQKNEQTYNYELTQVQSKEVIAPGVIKRVSVSVMVDGITDTTQLTSLKSAVIAAAGIDQKRGDTVSFETYAFDHSYATQQETATAQQTQTDLYFKLGQYALAGLAVLVLVLIVMGMFSNLRKTTSEQWKPVMRPVGEMALAAGMAGASASVPMLSHKMSGGMEAIPALPAVHEAENTALQVQNRIAEMSSRNAPTAEDEQLQKLMTQMVDESPATVAEIIQMWLSEDEKRHG